MRAVSTARKRSSTWIGDWAGQRSSSNPATAGRGVGGSAVARVHGAPLPDEGLMAGAAGMASEIFEWREGV